MKAAEALALVVLAFIGSFALSQLASNKSRSEQEDIELIGEDENI